MDKIPNQFKRGDKVRLKTVNAEHGGLRYEIPEGAVGTVTYVMEPDRYSEWMFVDWGVGGEGAMRMWPEELEAADE